MTNSSAPTLVFVHGAWHGAWTWDAVVPLLSNRNVVAVDLPTIDAPSAGLAEDAEALRGTVSAIDGPVVVVAHSFGGVVATEALADLPNVVHILYISAFVLEKGDSLLELAGGTPPEWWRVRDDGLVDAATPAEIFFNDLPEAAAQAAVDQLRPHSFQPFVDKQTATAWRQVPTTYLVTTNDSAIPDFVQRLMAQRCTNVLEIDTSHSPFLSRPEYVADLIDGLH